MKSSRFPRFFRLYPSVTALTATIAAALAAPGCSSPPLRKPASEARVESMAIPRDFGAGLKQFLGYLDSERFTQADCAPFLNAVFDEIRSSKPEHFEREKLVKDAPELVRDLFAVRLKLRKALGRMLAAGPVDESCVTAMRNGMRAARFIDEYLAERINNAPNANSFTGGFPYVQINPEFGSADGAIPIKSGDVLLSRGWAFTSAAIARVGEIDGQFSHLAIAYVDEKTSKTYVVEAHIEVGVAVTTWEKYATDGKMRAVVFRHPDAALAHQAAKIAYDRAMSASATGKNIPYDFGMVLASDDEMFCSEVPYYGYHVASGGRIELPLFQSRMSMKNRQFLDAIGVNVSTTFAPSDMEVDPRFELVGEWRNLGLATNGRMKDATLTKVFEWADERGYLLRNTPFEKLVRAASFRARRWPIFDRLLEKQFPLNMSKETLGVIFSLHSVVDPIVAELEKADKVRFAKTGFGMTFTEAGEFLELLRANDYELYRNHKAWSDMHPVQESHPAQPEPPKPLFHYSFGPDRLND
ncbi:MAG: hypothetical protein NDJ89_08460 [Oligoflexia bacterium]|nr:hypothetical protein [Oligoflexia bacterium]